MTTKDAPLCAIYDQISDRRCGYYAGHGGRHNFEPVVIKARELRRALDLFAEVWCPEHGHAPKPEQITRAAELRKLVGL